MEAVIFDMDGVIFDSERAVVSCWVELAEKYGISGIEEACEACIGINAAATGETMKKIYGEEFDYDGLAKEASVMYHQRYDGGRLPMKPGVKELLQGLKEMGCLIALASSTRRALVVQQLQDAGLISFFDVIIGGDCVERSKPAPDIFLAAARELGVEPDRAYVIEDSYNGIRAAVAAGMHSIMVPDMLPANEEMREKAEMILPSLKEVLDYFINVKKI